MNPREGRKINANMIASVSECEYFGMSLSVISSERVRMSLRAESELIYDYECMIVGKNMNVL